MDAIRSFLDQEGRLKAFPAKRKKKLYCLIYLAGKFTPGQEYAEREVNGLLNRWTCFEDPATLRRELFDYGFLDRDRAGTCYRLAAQQPTAQTLGLE